MTRVIVLITMVAAFCLGAFAQAGGSTAEIRGRVVDPNGAVVRGATITLTDPARGFSRTANSDENGEYRFLSLTPGVYQIKVEASGFSTQVKNSVQVTVGQTADQDFAMQVGDATATVEITGDTPLIETDRSQQSTTLSERVIRDLPIDRRDYLTFTLLAPGVVDSNALADNSDFRVTQTPQSGLSFYGNNGRGNSVTVDGSEANDRGRGSARPSARKRSGVSDQSEQLQRGIGRGQRRSDQHRIEDGDKSCQRQRIRLFPEPGVGRHRSVQYRP
ncbi:MAG: carboxypeptidase regulatory-like domain-containing protein [Chloracidobacterium sp.]|nr:carboxypeptidase regulatory-like domain-containing protein [Chloracidobacterium sp.]